ncbi:hypothetical protein N658DRAFT_313373 [Parathielavia hyrcaniae]|uniref:Uncharacterized protein n=1 Tax=Parathielavia hyrcaniae TaxID=113614 RepID=A0AAN6SXL1_9PEZI|nr:hypothetical protein N658DRAFT_313373 [Parathielavia hyrcaniae]
MHVDCLRNARCFRRFGLGGREDCVTSKQALRERSNIYCLIKPANPASPWAICCSLVSEWTDRDPTKGLLKFLASVSDVSSAHTSYCRYPRVLYKDKTETSPPLRSLFHTVTSPCVSGLKPGLLPCQHNPPSNWIARCTTANPSPACSSTSILHGVEARRVQRESGKTHENTVKGSWPVQLQVSVRGKTEMVNC